jgi:hypothetical protein
MFKRFKKYISVDEEESSESSIIEEKLSKKGKFKRLNLISYLF